MLFDLLIALIYLFVHTLVLFYHGVALTCAVNSNNNVLITLLISNNFVELKSDPDPNPNPNPNPNPDPNPNPNANPNPDPNPDPNPGPYPQP